MVAHGPRHCLCPIELPLCVKYSSKPMKAAFGPITSRASFTVRHAAQSLKPRLVMVISQYSTTLAERETPWEPQCPSQRQPQRQPQRHRRWPPPRPPLPHRPSLRHFRSLRPPRARLRALRVADRVPDSLALPCAARHSPNDLSRCQKAPGSRCTPSSRQVRSCRSPPSRWLRSGRSSRVASRRTACHRSRSGSRECRRRACALLPPRVRGRGAGRR
mmetsp:Transcript_48386/g.135702  ORF Transcript_48386/g.135702 Transcript_48386/m.135702 type:complete len:217 (+) Transcript_48386:574-1224(+)